MTETAQAVPVPQHSPHPPWSKCPGCSIQKQDGIPANSVEADPGDFPAIKTSEINRNQSDVNAINQLSQRSPMDPSDASKRKLGDRWFASRALKARLENVSDLRRITGQMPRRRISASNLMLFEEKSGHGPTILGGLQKTSPVGKMLFNLPHRRELGRIERINLLTRIILK